MSRTGAKKQSGKPKSGPKKSIPSQVAVTAPKRKSTLQSAKNGSIAAKKAGVRQRDEEKRRKLDQGTSEVITMRFSNALPNNQQLQKKTKRVSIEATVKSLQALSQNG